MTALLFLNTDLANDQQYIAQKHGGFRFMRHVIPSVRIRHAVVVAAALCVASSPPSRADEFYTGKTITLSTYTGPGGGQDTYLRLFARHFGKHILGRPGVVVSNQPGAGGLLAINHAGKVAAQDGTFLTLVGAGLPVHEATGRPGLQVSLGEFKWVGNLSQSNAVLLLWHTSKIKTLDDAKVQQAVVGATGAGSISAQMPAVYNALLGTRFKTVFGYEGSAKLNFAMQQGEIDGRGTATWASIKTTLPNAIRDGHLNVLLQVGLRKEADLPNVPLLSDLVRGEPQKEAVARFLSLAMAIARPIAAPPGVPDGRVVLLRHAFDAMMQDAEFLAEAQRLGAEIDPMSGADVQEAIRQILATPRDVIERTQAALAMSAN
jgi:tripartite-type tricarboxylate transporter receptor subunit TctC